MKVIKITNKEELNRFISRQEYSQFLQSWEWGAFQKEANNKVVRIGVENNGRLEAAAMIVKKSLPFGKGYFYCPRGPVAKAKTLMAKDNSGLEKKIKTANFLFEEIKRLAKEENVIFLRLEPKNQLYNQIINGHWPLVETIAIQPKRTLVLNLGKSEEELLRDMHQKTRYNIKLAQKKGVKVIAKQDTVFYFEKFWQLATETSQRDKFRLHSREYYKQMLKCCQFELDLSNKESLIIKLFLAEYKGRILAGNIVSFFGDTATYMHGASSNEYRNVMAPYLLQWQAIKLARQFGYKYYDFYGIDKNKWPGVTRFKKGFGGREFEYSGTYDLVFNRLWYSIYGIGRKIRRGL